MQTQIQTIKIDENRPTPRFSRNLNVSSHHPTVQNEQNRKSMKIFSILEKIFVSFHITVLFHFGSVQ